MVPVPKSIRVSSIASAAIDTAPLVTEKWSDEKDAIPFAAGVASSPLIVSVVPVAAVASPVPPATVRLSLSRSISIVPLSDIKSRSCAVT